MTQAEVKSEIDKYSIFTNSLNQLLHSLLDSYKVKYHVIESRTKTIESLTEKLERKEIQSLDEVTDISGLRIILYYQDDVDKVVESIRENFIIDEKNSVNKAELYNSNEFGYLSVHYIVSINKKRIVLPEWASYKDYKAEIQIRTVLQHSWASISHELSYKKKYDIPKELERKLYRLAGLFELADEQFLKIRDEHNILKSQIEGIESPNEIEEEKINFLTITYLLQPNNNLGIFKEIEELALEAGFKNKEYNLDERYVSELIKITRLLGLKNIRQMSSKLNEVKPYLLDYYNELLNRTERREWTGDMLFYLILALLFSFDKNQLDTFKEQNKDWSEKVLERVASTIIEQKKL